MIKKRNALLALLSTFVIFFIFALLQSISNPFTSLQEAKYLAQPLDTKGFFKSSIFTLGYIFSILAIISAIFTRRKLVAFILLLLIGISYGSDIFIQLIGTSDKGISYALFAMGMAEKSRATDLMMFKTLLFQASLFIIFFFCMVAFLRNILFVNFRIHSLLSIILLLLAITLSWGSVRVIFSIVGQSYPAPIKLSAIALEYFFTHEANKPRILDESVVTKHPSKMNTIVWIIDESVGGQYLSVNGFDTNTTPYLKELSENNTDFLNFGVVPSISNCSASSNLLLRIGLTNNFQNDFQNNVKTLPTIFQYAKRAGFKTTLIDAQIAEGQLQNHMSVRDTKYLDNFITLSRSFIPKHRDVETKKNLIKILNEKDDQNRFIVVVKWGSHWPYSLTYDNEIFKPAARDSYTEFNEENKELVLNAYFNSLYHSVDGFLKSINTDNDLKNKIIFYTADHGQNLYKNDDPLTHCSLSDTIRIDEFKVPLMAFSKDIKHTLIKPSNKQNSQEQLFSTTLKLMGYGDSLIKSYGPTLSEGAEPNTIRTNLQLTGKSFLYLAD